MLRPLVVVFTPWINKKSIGRKRGKSEAASLYLRREYAFVDEGLPQRKSLRIIDPQRRTCFFRLMRALDLIKSMK
jgi:hypothetical protein